MNQLVELTVERLAFGGDGVGHLEGRAVFVPGTLPLEVVLVEPIQVKDRLIRARCAEIIRQSSQRRPLDCLHEFAQGCGGCGFRHVADPVSLDLKVEAALDTLERLAPGIDWPRPVIHREPQLDGQRGRAKFHSQQGRLGFFARSTHTLVPVPRCRALHPLVAQGVRLVETALSIDKSGSMPGTVLVEASDSLRFACLEGPVSPRQLAALEELTSSGLFAGIRCRQRRHQVHLGQTWIREPFSIHGHPLALLRRIGTFAQANPSANQTIRLHLHDRLQQIQPKILVELFAGSGNLSLVAALSSTQVLALEGDPEAVGGLDQSASANGLGNLRSVRRDLTRPIGTFLQKSLCDVILLDPPRTGAVEIMADLLESTARHLLYLSCSPPHLARDVKHLSGAYRIQSLDAFDMFPRTPHLELLAWLTNVRHG